MLPTKGYFQDIECPFYDNTCNRPYCHFRHRKKPTATTEETTIEEMVEEAEVPTYKPTPKSELANIKNHIPISYVPDLTFRRDRVLRPTPKFSFEKPTYKPTPLSLLSSVKKLDNDPQEDGKPGDEDIEAIREIKQNIANVEYNPEVSLQGDINFESLSAEFDMIDEIIRTKSEKKEEDAKTVKSSKEKLKKSSKSQSHHKKDDKHKHRSKEKDKKKRSVHKSSKERERSHTKEKDKRKNNKSKTKDRDKERPKEKPVKVEKIKPQKYSPSSSDNEIGNLNDYSDDDDDYCKDDTLSECYKIFTEYEAPKVEMKEPAAVASTDEEPEDSAVNRKRIAHSGSLAGESGSKIKYIKPKTQPTAENVMVNRFKLAKLAQASNEQKNIMNEVKQTTLKLAQASNEQKNIMNEVKQTTTKRPPPTLLEAARKYKLQRLSKVKPAENVCLLDTILNSSSKPRKIAPVANVGLIQRAKAQIDEMARQRAAMTLSKTTAQTAKGSKRVAHIPDISLSDIPDVLNADKSKLPVNVRTRFLTLLADECVKLYLRKEDAFNRALNEEFACYEKCKVLVTYKNSAMLAVNRLRKELQERERLGLGPITDSESSHKDKASDFKGRKFYDTIKRYVLSEADLELHGYPRQSSVSGRATVKNRKNQREVLADNQRKCCRCFKIYLVDDEGFALFQQDCIYHPLKKRTLRGEQTYLCCKTSDGTGCVTSNTHVMEASGEAELEGYQTTMEPDLGDDPRSSSVYALDCEMCYTVKGLELTRVTIVDCECKIVYESLVKPLNPIIDYNTTFSGITKEQMERTSTSILQVQANILHLCNSETILIGHSLESDMKALKIIHGTIVDTSVLFPHKMGLPHKRALRVLASEHLNKIIQNNVNGHDSAEDAIACMDLVKWKLKEELKVRGLK